MGHRASDGAQSKRWGTEQAMGKRVREIERDGEEKANVEENKRENENLEGEREVVKVECEM